MPIITVSSVIILSVYLKYAAAILVRLYLPMTSHVPCQSYNSEPAPLAHGGLHRGFIHYPPAGDSSHTQPGESQPVITDLLCRLSLYPVTNVVPRLPRSETNVAIVKVGRAQYLFSCEHDVIRKGQENFKATFCTLFSQLYIQHLVCRVFISY